MRGTKTGDYGENVVFGYLRGKGYSILETKYRRRHGEIDIIARDSTAIVFIEVKYRRTFAFGTPAESVTPRKQHALLTTALQYIAENEIVDCDFRFDVIEVFGKELLELNHIENAFGQ